MKVASFLLWIGVYLTVVGTILVTFGKLVENEPITQLSLGLTIIIGILIMVIGIFSAEIVVNWYEKKWGDRSGRS